MNPIDPSKFSLDYLIENKVITILSQDYAFEHGTDWDEVDIEEIIMNYIKYLCYPDDRGNPWTTIICREVFKETHNNNSN